MSSTTGIDAAAEKSNLVKEALELARQTHLGQLRRGSDGRPYIEHPIAVAELMIEHGFGDEVVAAALLHDVVEKSDTDVSAVRERFGEKVGELVEALTEDETIEIYEERKKEHRWRVARAGAEALAIFGADKLTNVVLLREAYSLIAEGVSDELEVPLDLKIYVWEGDLEMLFDEAPDMALTNDLADELVGLWGDRFRVVRDATD